MNDFISKQVAIDAIVKDIMGGLNYENILKELPTADVRENVRGEWLDCEVVHDRKDAKITDWQQARCSVCGKWHTTPYMYSWYHFEYCPNCGADMRGGKE